MCRPAPPARHDSPPDRLVETAEDAYGRTFVVTVEDLPGVLNRISSPFRRRGFNIESLTVGHTERPGVSRMTFVVLTDDAGASASRRTSTSW